MTIIQPARIRRYQYFFIVLFALVFGGGMVYIYLYNTLADAKYQRKLLQEKIQEVSIANVDAKNVLYQIIHPTRLESIAKNYNLVLEKKPEYYSNKWVSDSSR